MTTTEKLPLLAAIPVLTARVSQVLSAPAGQEGILHRIEVPIDTVDPMGWLLAQEEAPRYYWADRRKHFVMAGVGDADVVLPQGATDVDGTFRLMRSRLPQRSPSLRYYGGFRFHSGPVKTKRWGKFSEHRFIVPRIEIIQREKGCFLACNFMLGTRHANGETLEATLADIAKMNLEPATRGGRLPAVHNRVDTPDFKQWSVMVNQVLDACAENRLEKVVLARETTFVAEEAIDPVQLLDCLLERTTKAFEFCFQPVHDRAFVGASPERLFRRSNVLLQSEALAGTRPRGATDVEDEAMASQLKHSDKEQREHRFVARVLREQLKRFCVAVDMEEKPSLLQLRHCQHLLTRIEGILSDSLVDAALINTLHPTPAVGGVPRDAALAWLEKHEPFDRGVYAAPVGWVGYDASEFCVGIRSALVQGENLTLYAGAGIVPGSTPESEWAEIENKIENFMAVLNHED